MTLSKSETLGRKNETIAVRMNIYHLFHVRVEINKEISHCIRPEE